MLAGALGAVLGDSALYWLARTGPRKLKARLEAASEGRACREGTRSDRTVRPAVDRVRPFRARRSLRRQCLDGADRVSLPTLPALLSNRRDGVGRLHVPVGLLGRHGAGRFPARIDGRLGNRHDHSHPRGLLDRPPPASRRGLRASVSRSRRVPPTLTANSTPSRQQRGGRLATARGCSAGDAIARRR
jgi:hypothetical protein